MVWSFFVRLFKCFISNTRLKMPFSAWPRELGWQKCPDSLDRFDKTFEIYLEKFLRLQRHWFAETNDETAKVTKKKKNNLSTLRTATASRGQKSIHISNLLKRLNFWTRKATLSKFCWKDTLLQCAFSMMLSLTRNHACWVTIDTFQSRLTTIGITTQWRLALLVDNLNLIISLSTYLSGSAGSMLHST